MDFPLSKHFLQILVAQGQNFLLRFSVFETSLIEGSTISKSFNRFLRCRRVNSA